MQNIHEAKHLRNSEFVFSDREDAGKKLGILLEEQVGADGMLLAIPSGGVSVAVAMQPYLIWPLELLMVRKIQIPHNPEAGFGAINIDGDRFYNERLLEALHLSWEMIEVQVKKTMETIKQRNTLFRCDTPFPDLSGKDVIIADDGLASGYTMQAAIHLVRKRKPASITVAVPTAAEETAIIISKEIDQLYCLNIRDGYPFAVASAYLNWHDLSDKDVLGLIGRNPCQ